MLEEVFSEMGILRVLYSHITVILFIFIKISCNNYGRAASLYTLRTKEEQNTHVLPYHLYYISFSFKKEWLILYTRWFVLVLFCFWYFRITSKLEYISKHLIKIYKYYNPCLSI